MRLLPQRVMMPIKRHRVAVGITAAILLGVAWYLFRPELLFIDATVDEDFPTSAAAKTTPANAAPLIVSQGTFHGVAHAGKGRATIHQLADGSRVLRLTDFETSNGPALHVRLIAASDAKDNDTV